MFGLNNIGDTVHHILAPYLVRLEQKRHVIAMLGSSCSYILSYPISPIKKATGTKVVSIFVFLIENRKMKSDAHGCMCLLLLLIHLTMLPIFNILFDEPQEVRNSFYVKNMWTDSQQTCCSTSRFYQNCDRNFMVRHVCVGKREVELALASIFSSLAH